MTLDSLKESKEKLPALVGSDGNAFALMGKFSVDARRAGWSKEEVDFVLAEAMEGEYNNLLRVLTEFTED